MIFLSAHSQSQSQSHTHKNNVKFKLKNKMTGDAWETAAALAAWRRLSVCTCTLGLMAISWFKSLGTSFLHRPFLHKFERLPHFSDFQRILLEINCFRCEAVHAYKISGGFFPQRVFPLIHNFREGTIFLAYIGPNITAASASGGGYYTIFVSRKVLVLQENTRFLKW